MTLRGSAAKLRENLRRCIRSFGNSSYLGGVFRWVVVVLLAIFSLYATYVLFWIGLRNVDTDRLQCHAKLRAMGPAICGWRHGSHLCMWRGEDVAGVDSIVDLKDVHIDWAYTLSKEPLAEHVREAYVFCPADADGLHPSDTTRLYSEVFVRHENHGRQGSPTSAKGLSKCVQILLRYENLHDYCASPEERKPPDHPIPFPAAKAPTVVAKRV